MGRKHCIADFHDSFDVVVNAKQTAARSKEISTQPSVRPLISQELPFPTGVG